MNNDYQATLILMLTSAQLNGTTPIEINGPINKQVLELTSYSFKNDNASDYVNIYFGTYGSASHLIDSSATTSALALPLGMNATSSFVENCSIPFSLDRQLDRSFYIRAEAYTIGTPTPVTLANHKMMLVFKIKDI